MRRPRPTRFLCPARLLRLAAVAGIALVLSATGAVAQSVLEVWSTTWDSAEARDDDVTAAVPTAQGGVVLAGTSNLQGSLGPIWSAMAVGFTPTGAVAWEWLRGTELPSSLLGLRTLGDGTLVAARVDTAGVRTVELRRLDAAGATVWMTRIAHDAVIDPDDSFALDVGADGLIRLALIGPVGPVLHVFTGAGALVATFDLVTDAPVFNVTDVVADAAGNAYLAVLAIHSGGPMELSVLAVDPGGQVRWRHGETGPVGSTFFEMGVVLLPDGGVAAAGTLESSCGGPWLRTWCLDPSDGALRWSDDLGVDPCDSVDFVDLAADTAGNLVVLGTGAVGPSSFDADYQFVSYDAAGGRRWHRQVDGDGTRDVAADLAMGRTGGVVATGHAISAGVDWEMFTVALAADGNERWRRTWSTAPGVDSAGRAVGVAANGEVLVAGISGGANLKWDAAAVRYHALSPSSVAPSGEAGLRVGAVTNPCAGATTVRYALPRSEAFTLTVHDLRGRRVSVLRDGYAAAGSHEVGWSGRDDRGRPLPSGTYLLRLQTARGAATQRVTLVR